MQEESIRMIVNSGDLLLTVVNDVLDYSKLESGNVEIEIQHSSLQEALSSFVHSIEMKAQASNLSVRTFYNTALPEFVTTDSRRLQQILYNLLGNAIKFSKDGGVVEFHVSLCDATSNYTKDSDSCPRTGKREVAPSLKLQTNDFGEASQCPFQSSETSSTQSSQPSTDSGASGCPFQRSSSPSVDASFHDLAAIDKVEIKYETPTHAFFVKERVIRLVVKDYGKGIARKDFDRIFKPFQQSNAETERVYGGTGLGLAITAKLVSALGGTISVDSEEGRWSEFTVDLPFRGTPVDAEGISGRLAHSTVLLVHKETDPSLAQVINVFRQYKVDYVYFKSIDEMDQAIVKEGFLSTTRSYICLLDEDMYCSKTFELLSNMSTAILLTFGPEYSVKEATSHYRSLVQVLPSVFLQSIGSHVEALANAGGNGIGVKGVVKSDVNGVPYKELRVLIAEDNKINQKVLMRMLTRLGIKNVDIVDNGRKAVDHESSQAYDVVLMDMQMPVMDGIEACRLISGRQGGHPKAKVVFVTAHVSTSFEAECARAGSVGFIPKPFNVRDIEKCFDGLQL